jgi:LAGLIDADG endonuclease
MGKTSRFFIIKKNSRISKTKTSFKGRRSNKILEFKASLNKGLSPELEKAFPDVIPVARPIVQLPFNLDTNLFIGFIVGEGSFGVNITKGTTKIGYLVQIKFNLTQQIRDAGLLKLKQE